MKKKRINLSFDLERNEDRKAYNLIQSSRGKTKYVIDAVLLAVSDNNEGFHKDRLKEVVKEAIVELGLDIKISEKKENNIDNSKIEQNQILDDLFNMISGL
ncbi:hypothetical protein [Anaerophilus nitritogenes]|uniref:hypothetical protein n=1 Tax=Anaerophilus nitritogenes TaxID=2498136 RepID=UPI00101CE409|nr:hypothetical protein [Anaerophilus nitritogenes]